MKSKISWFGNEIKALAGILLIIGSITATGQIIVAPKATAAPTCENMDIAGVTAIGHEGSNVPANTIDNNLRSRWSHEGIGSWIIADLGEQNTVCSVSIAWYKGDSRVNNFVVSVSADGKRYTNVYSGTNSKTTSLQTYSFAETTAEYVKITVNGNNQGLWASITEIDVYGYTPVDDTKPSVNISNPVADSTISATSTTLLVAGSASDNVLVDKVELRVDAGSYILATPKAPGDWSTWTLTVDVGSFGNHRLVPRATDSSGNQAWNSMYVTFVELIAPDTTSPTVKISSPIDGSTIILTGDTITIQGTASDAESGVSTVKVRVDTGSYVEATPKAAGDWSTWSVTLPITEGERRLVPRATDNEGNHMWNSIYVTVQSSSTGAETDTSTLDKFGIEKLYPTAAGGNEWYVNMLDPASDPLFRNLPSMTLQSDGSWQVNGGTKGQVRMEAWSPSNEKWLNVEITGYAKMVSGSNELIQWYSRGGHHTSSNECLGSAVKARLYGDGEARWVKEINHPAYTGNRGAVEATNEPLADRWIGFKAVMYNFVENGRTYVRMESYIDDKVTDANGNLAIANNWQLASVVEDRGGWGTNDSDFNSSCAPLNKDSTQQYRQRDEIINMPGGTSTQNIAAWRSDDLTWNWKYLSAREINAP
jgi:hypothetical protein